MGNRGHIPHMSCGYPHSSGCFYVGGGAAHMGLYPARLQFCRLGYSFRVRVDNAPPYKANYRVC